MCNNSDPFGLKVCFEGDESQRRTMADALAVAAEITYTWNSGTGCMENARPIHPGNAVAEQVAGFINHVTKTAIFAPGRLPGSGSGSNTGSGVVPSSGGADVVRILIDFGDVKRRYGVVPYVLNNGQTRCSFVPGARYTMEMIMIHETGHTGYFFDPVQGVDEAMTFERAYTSRVGMPLRPDECHK